MRSKSVYLLISVFCFISWSCPLPDVFLVGDSISIHYTPYLKNYLLESLSLNRKEDNGQAEKNLDIPVGANGGDSRMVLNYLKHKLDEPGFHPDYLLLNCGLHDIKRSPSTNRIQIEEEVYKANLVEIFQRIKQKNIQPVWISTTCVYDDIHNVKSKGFKRFNADVQRYNSIADSICEQMNIPVIDLYRFSKQLPIESVIDHVHYSDEARSQQAAYIAGYLQRLLQVNR